MIHQGAMPSEASLPPTVYIPCIGPIKKNVSLLREAYAYCDELHLCILEQTLSNPALFLLFLQLNPIPKPHAAE